MTLVRVVQHIDATPERVWRELSDLASHVEWMQDAVAIRFTSDQRQGVGTTFDCETKIGPLKTTDKIEITNWVDEKEMTVRHSGVVTGTGIFHLDAHDEKVDVIWEERLNFPIYFGSKIGEAVAKPIFRKIWSENLRNLKKRVEASD